MRFPRSDKRKCYRKCFYPVEHKQLIVAFKNLGRWCEVMCALCSKFNYSSKWKMFLVIIMSAYTTLHWFVAVPLLHSHLNECCEQKFSKNWTTWFLAISVAFWLGISILIFLIWTCLKLAKAKHSKKSDISQAEKGNANPEENKTETSESLYYEKNAAGFFLKSPGGTKESDKIVVTLPDFKTSENLAVLKVNDPQSEESSVSQLDCPIPVDETRHYVQSERLPSPVKDGRETPLKTPREIFFKDLIEGAPEAPPNCHFHRETMSLDYGKSYELAMLMDDDKEQSEEITLFVESLSKKKNLTSEVLVTLKEKGVMVENPVMLGQFQILKE